jgi:hypothetical protein
MRAPLALTAAALLLARPASAANVESCAAAYEDAQQLRQDAKLRAARDALIRCTQPSCPAVVRSDCLVWLREVEESTPTVIVGATDADGRDVTDVLVTIDGATAHADGKAVALDPGPHRFAFSDRGRTIALEALVREGEKNRRIDARFPAEPVAAPPARPLTGAWIAAGVAAAAVASFAVFGTWAVLDRSSLRDSCFPQCAHDDVQAVHTHAAIADVSLVIGVLGAGLSAWLFLSARPERR